MAEEMPFTSEEIKKLRELLEVEAIRKVRVLYSQLLDGGEIDALAAIFTEDVRCASLGRMESGRAGKRSEQTTSRCFVSRSNISLVPCTIQAIIGSN